MNGRSAKWKLLTANRPIVNFVRPRRLPPMARKRDFDHHFANSVSASRSFSVMYRRVAAGSSFQILIETAKPTIANGIRKIGHHCQL
jgi:hypothetical protein